MSANAERKTDLAPSSGGAPPICPGRPEAAAVNWRWRNPGHEGAEPASELPGSLRVRGLIQGAITGAIGAAVFLFWWRGFGIAILVFASVVALSALLSPSGLYAMLLRLFAATGNVVGRALTWLLLTPMFYGFFLPFGAIMRRNRRDRLKRFYDAEASTYWEDHEGETLGSRSLERQY